MCFLHSQWIFIEKDLHILSFNNHINHIDHKLAPFFKNRKETFLQSAI
jgi:hypothetical protein